MSGWECLFLQSVTWLRLYTTNNVGIELFAGKMENFSPACVQFVSLSPLPFSIFTDIS